MILAMPLSDHVTLTITIQSVGIPRAGFGLPMVLSHNAGWSDRIRYYTSTSGAAQDGFDSDSPEGRSLAALFSQTPKPPRVAIGRATASVTQAYAISAPAARSSEKYTITAQGEGFDDSDASYTSTASATPAQIHDGLVTALNATADKNFTAALATLTGITKPFTAATTDVCTAAAHALQTGDGPLQVSNSGGALPAGLTAVTDYYPIVLDANTFKLASSRANAFAGTAVDITDTGTGTQTIASVAATRRATDPFTVTGNAAGDWFSLEVYNASALHNAQTHTVSGIGADLDAILTEASGSFYCVLTNYNSKDYVGDVAAWAEPNSRIYVVDSCDTDLITLAYSHGVTTDVGSVLFDLGYARTMLAYHPRPAAMLAPAWMGRWLPTDPGKATTKFKTLSGTETVLLTDTHRANLRARRANTYETVAGRGITWEGTVPSATYKFLDVTRNLDWLSDDVVKSVFGDLADQDVVPYDEDGLLLVQNAVSGSMQRAIRQGVFAPTPAPVVTVPELADIVDADKADRILRNVAFSGTLAGAVHHVDLDGSVSF